MLATVSGASRGEASVPEVKSISEDTSIDHGPVTRTEWAEHEIRQMVLQGILVPKERIVLAAIAKRLGMSPSPIREALARLSVEHLVELTPHGSAVVAEVSIAEALEVYELRLLLEPRAFALSVTAASTTERKAWQDAFDRLESGPDPIDNLRHHARFHRAMLSGCPSAWMLRTIAPLQDYSMRMVILASSSLDRSYHVSDDHQRLLELGLDGDAEGAQRELHGHLQRSSDLFRAHLTGSAISAAAIGGSP